MPTYFPPTLYMFIEYCPQFWRCPLLYDLWLFVNEICSWISFYTSEGRRRKSKRKRLLEDMLHRKPQQTTRSRDDSEKLGGRWIAPHPPQNSGSPLKGFRVHHSCINIAIHALVWTTTNMATCVRFYIPKVVTMKKTAFWDMMMWRFGMTYCHDHHPNYEDSKQIPLKRR
jgi:hypothetical protein